MDRIPRSEILAVITPVPMHARENLAFRNEHNKRVKQQIKTALPFFYPAQAFDALPVIKVNKPSDAIRPERMDRKIESSPFLPAIHAHRY